MFTALMSLALLALVVVSAVDYVKTIGEMHSHSTAPSSKVPTN